MKNHYLLLFALIANSRKSNTSWKDENSLRPAVHPENTTAVNPESITIKLSNRCAKRKKEGERSK